MADTSFDSSAPDYPNLQGSNSSATNMKNSVANSAANTMNSIQNSQAVQSIANGPVADKARAEAATTKNEFSNLAASRQTPESKTATGQNLTHYHSLFYSLLSWENPRATAISFATIVTGILLTRYVPIERYVLKAAFTVLGITAAAELAGQFIFGQGFATTMRPRKYYTIPRETLESFTGDVEELINFFVIEFQRILFAENVWATILAFFTTLIGYFLVKVTPKWGLLLLSTFVVYLTPLVYIKNKDFIDQHLNNATNIASKQTAQLRQVAAQNANKAMEATSSATSQYVSVAQEYIGSAKKTAVDKGYISKETAEKAPGAPVEKDYTTSAPVEKSSSPIAPVENTSAPVEHSSAPVEHSSAPIEHSTAPVLPESTHDFPSAPSTEPQVVTEPHAVDPVPSATAESVSTHGIEEKKEPLHAL